MTTNSHATVPDALIVGAGPTGMTAAIELVRRGRSVRIVDMGAGTTPHSNAVGINARSLELLEASGVSDRLLADGIKMERLVAHDLSDGRDDPFLKVELSRIDHPRYRFVLGLAQSRTEAILLKRLSELGVTVEWRTELTGFTQDEDSVTATLKIADGDEAAARAVHLLGADGAHSVVRKTAGIGFIGERYPEIWYLADLPIDWDRPETQLNAFTQAGGGMLFTICLGDGRWRAISNRADFRTMLPDGARTGTPVWTSEFHISCRLAERYANGRVFLAGDAAHIHPPAGGRGMNLGMEDAWEFARRLGAGELAGYSDARLKIGRNVVKQTDQFLRTFTLKNPFLRRLLHLAGRTIARTAFAQRRALTNVAGLDPKRTLPEPGSA